MIHLMKDKKFFGNRFGRSASRNSWSVRADL